MASILRLGASAAVAAVALVLLPAPAPGGPARSGLYGTVRKGPIMPVCKIDVPCDGPVHGTLVISRSGRTVTRAHTTEQGRYRIALAPGFYEIRSTTKIGVTRMPTPHAVHVRPGHWDKINLFFDTGIR